MNTLSIKQPWADLICYGLKDCENRSWRPELRPHDAVLIHASRNYDHGMVLPDDVRAQASPCDAEKFLASHSSSFHTRLGAIVGCAIFDRSTIARFSPWHQVGYVGFYFSAAIAFGRPVPLRGQLGLFHTDLAWLKSELLDTDSHILTDFLMGGTS